MERATPRRLSFLPPAELQQGSQPHQLLFVPLRSASSRNEAISSPASLSSVQKSSGPALHGWMAQHAVLQGREETDTKRSGSPFHLLHYFCSEQERGTVEKSCAPLPAPSATLLVTARAVRQDHKCPRIAPAALCAGQRG